MLKAEKRHRKGCRYGEYNRAHSKCTCPYRAIGVLEGAFIRKSLKTSNYETAVEFAAEYLNADVPIETVSLLLGHASVKVTEKHYAKFNRARQLKIDDAVRAAWKSKRPKLKVIEGSSKSAA